MARRAASGRARRLALVVNAPGLQVRRAEAFRRHLAPRYHVEVTVAPGSRQLAGLRAADAVYVIDPGRRGFPAVLAGRMLRRPVVVELGDPQGELYRVQGRGPLASRIGSGIDRVVSRHADAVVVRGRGLADILDVRAPWIEVPDGVDLDHFRPGRDGGVRATLGVPEDALVVGLTGSLHWSQKLRFGYGWDVVEALAHLRDQPVWALIVGAGAGLQHLGRRAAELGVEGRIVFPGEVPHHEVPCYLGAMDVCVSTQSNDAIGRGRTTAKLPEYLACDRFVLATVVGAAAEVLPSEMLLPYEGQRDDGHPGRLAQRLAGLVPRRRELRVGAGTRRIAEQLYCYRLLATKVQDLLDRVLSTRARD